MTKHWRRWLAMSLVGLLAVGCYCVGKPALLLTQAWFQDRPAAQSTKPGFVDDASRLNETRVAEVWPIPAEPERAEVQLRELLQRARQSRIPISIAGARHTMGGHTIAPDGIVLDMLPFRHLEYDPQRQVLRAGAGARWSEIIPFLDARGMSVAVMQSNNNFSVGGSISVNCHGWQHNMPPIAATVESFRLMNAIGDIVRCSRHENQELFSLVLGGYGLFGVILDVELRVVPNVRYRPELELLPSSRYVERFAAKTLGAGNIGLVFGRLCVVPGEKFLREAMLVTFRQHPCKPEEIPALKPLGYETLRREVYRTQIGSQSGKELRWKTETTLGERFARHFYSRNQLMNEPAEIFQERNADRTDILHEYFIPTAQFMSFVERLRALLPRHSVDLLNITVRNITEDHDTMLRYADRDLFAFVMLFHQPRTQAADRQLEALTRELVDAALECGGRYYLPYRLHATREQFDRAYPMARTFFERKRHYDPDGMFQNQFSLKYGSTP